jgi:glycosyltransferase involved in cell wall biosynthesis
VVHAHLGNSLLCAAVLTALGRQHLMFTQHFIKAAYREGTGPRIMARALAHRMVHKRVAFGIASTRLVRTEMVEHEAFNRAKTAVIPFGIDVRRIVEQARRGPQDMRAELNLPGDAVLLVTPARLEQVKGHATLLDTLPRVVERHPNTYLLLAGTGALEHALKEQARDRGIEERVRFLGQRTDVPRLLAGAALCVLPSYEDSFGLVLLEAMAVGTPIVACNSGGPAEIVVHGETGLLVPPHKPQELAQAIVALLSDRDRACAMGAAGRERMVSHFTARRMAEQTLQVYHEVVEGISFDST